MEIEEQAHHKMVLVTTHPSGADEWHCPACGRRVLIQWPPNYKKIVLESGDEYAIHSGGKGGITFGAPQLTQESENSTQDSDILSARDKARLVEWDQWLSGMGFENLWSGEA